MLYSIIYSLPGGSLHFDALWPSLSANVEVPGCGFESSTVRMIFFGQFHASCNLKRGRNMSDC